MACTTDYLDTQEENKSHLTLITIASSACFTLLFAATLPWAAYFTLLILGSTLFYTLDHWPHLRGADPDLPPAAAPQNDPLLEWIAGGSLFLFSLYFLSLSAFSQIVLCCVGSIGLSFYFIDQCVIGSQTSLDTALRNLVHQAVPDLQAIEDLLKFGADPFSPDDEGNHAFHLAIQIREDHHLTLALLNTLRKYTVNPDSTFKEVLIGFKVLRGDHVTWGNWWGHTKEMLHALRTPATRHAFYQATIALFHSYTPYLKALMLQITLYCRQHFRFPKNMEDTNRNNQHPEGKIEALFQANHPLKATLIAALAGDGNVDPPPPAPTEEQQNPNPIIPGFENAAPLPQAANDEPPRHRSTRPHR